MIEDETLHITNATVGGTDGEEEYYTMNDRELRRYDMFQRVRTFGRDQAADFPQASRVGAHLETLGRIVRDLDTAKARQKGGRATAREVLMDALRLDLQNVARTARAIAQDEPGFADRFPQPDSSSQSALLTTAGAYIDELKKPGVIERFTAHELPPSLAQELEDDLKAIADEKARMESADHVGVSSTAAIGELIRRGMKEVTYLDAIMHNKYARSAETLRAWQSASHIERISAREKPVGPVTTADIKLEPALPK